MIKKFDTITFDRPESFLHRVQWGPFVVNKNIEFDISATNLFQTYNFNKTNKTYNVTLDGLLMDSPSTIENFTGSFNICSIIQALTYNCFVDFKLTFDSGRLMNCSCEDLKEIFINKNKIKDDYENNIKKIKNNNQKNLKTKITLERKHLQALHELEMEKYKAEQLIVFNKKLVKEIKNISIIINA